MITRSGSPVPAVRGAISGPAARSSAVVSRWRLLPVAEVFARGFLSGPVPFAILHHAFLPIVLLPVERLLTIDGVLLILEPHEGIASRYFLAVASSTLKNMLRFVDYVRVLSLPEFLALLLEHLVVDFWRQVYVQAISRSLHRLFSVLGALICVS